MAKRPNLTDIVNVSTSASVHNANNDEIEVAFDNTLSRDGSTPNQMEADIDLNGNDLLNVGTVSAGDIIVDGNTVSASLAAAEAAAAAAEASASRVDLGELDSSVASASASATAAANSQTAAALSETAAETAQAGAEAAQIGAETAEASVTSTIDAAVASATSSATSSETAAAASASSAASSATIAQSARDAAVVNASVYDDTAAGIAATVSGDQFLVVEGNEIVRYENDTSVAVELFRYPSLSALSAMTETDNLKSSRQRFDDKRKESGELLPKAAVVVLIGQSLNVARGTTVQSKGAPIAKMPTGGASISDWAFFSLNETHAGHWDELSSFVDFEESAEQTPCVGVVNGLAGGKYPRVYIASSAIGSRNLDVLGAGGPASNTFAVISVMCDQARSDGYDPEVYFYSAHGESAASAGLTETDYYDLASLVYGRFQLWAAQSMRKPEYKAPFFLTRPVKGETTSDSYEDIQKAIGRLTKDLPNFFDLGPIYQWDVETDRIHPTPEGYVQRGEAVGRAIRNLSSGKGWDVIPEVVDVSWDGATTAKVYFNQDVVKDTNFDVGTSLNVGVALDGFEWFDNGSGVAISSATYSGPVVTLTLATTPTGLVNQQSLRVGMQYTSNDLTAGSDNLPGTIVRADESGWGSLYNNSYTNYRWAVQQNFDTVRSA